MARNRQTVAYLDTHIVVWLFAGLTEKLTEKAKQAIENNEVMISQMSKLELQCLFEIGRITVKPERILDYLSKVINLKISSIPLNEIIDEALKIGWTRDVFDRMLAAEARITDNGFITADEDIGSHLSQAIW